MGRSVQSGGVWALLAYRVEDERVILRTSPLRSSKKLRQKFIANSSPTGNKAGMRESA
jgi:hypothetical protein